MKTQLKKRLKSFAWRLGGMVVVAVLSFLIQPDTLSALNESGVVVPTIVTLVIGLVANEVTKWMNKKKAEPVRGV